ncbi:MAG: MBL fold metallo-hydrolase [Candidatus Caldarchaeum sp.]
MFRISLDGGVKAVYRGKHICFDAAYSEGAWPVRCISHAHSDHVDRLGEIITTRETADLMKHVWCMESWCRTVRYGERVILDDGLCLKAFNSGHVLGSAMFNIAGDGFDLTYTGDINTVETLTTQPAEVRKADTLVIESTYGHPEFVFPPRHQVYAMIVKWAVECLADEVIPAFKAYSIGKSQELIKLFNTYTTLPVVVGPTVAKASKIYVESGLKLDYLQTGEADGMRLLSSGGCVYIDSQMRRMTTHRRVKWAVATGWALRFSHEADAAFPLSSHADYRSLVEYVENAEPKKVYVFHGFSRSFANTLRRRGFDAVALG